MPYRAPTSLVSRDALALSSRMIDASGLFERGPHPVGVVTLEVTDPGDASRRLPVDIWYPAPAEFAGVDDDPARLAEHPFGAPQRAVRDLPPLDSSCPLVVFSHGNSGLRQQSTFLTSHLASHGIVVAAPDHIGNTFVEMQGISDDERRTRHKAARLNRPRDLSTTIDTVLAAESRLPGIDTRRIGAMGHSFGGWTALKMPARDERIRAVCCLAPAAEPFVGRRAFDEGELPLARDTPALLVAGIDDVLVELDASILSILSRLGPRRAAVGIAGADHFHFCDGIPLLHAVHENTPREGLSRPVRAYADLLDEARSHRLVRGLALRYFLAAFTSDADPCAPFRDDTSWFDPDVRPLRTSA